MLDYLGDESVQVVDFVVVEKTGLFEFLEVQIRDLWKGKAAGALGSSHERVSVVLLEFERVAPVFYGLDLLNQVSGRENFLLDWKVVLVLLRK